MHNSVEVGNARKKHVKKVLTSLQKLNETDDVLLDEIVIVGGSLYLLAISTKCASFCLNNFEWKSQKMTSTSASADLKKNLMSTPSYSGWKKAN